MPPEGTRFASIEMVEEMRRRMDEYGSVAAGLAGLTQQVAELRQSMRFLEQMLGELRAGSREAASEERARVTAEARTESRITALELAESGRKGRWNTLVAAIIIQFVALAVLALPKLISLVGR